MKKLYIVRGLPSSGKSTYARTLAPLVIEPDMFRYNENNEYVFDSDRNSEVIDKARRLCEYAVRGLKMPAIAVTAVFTKIEHFMPYVRFGRRYGYEVTVVECIGSYGNVHEVPEKTIEQMRSDWELFDEELANQEGVSLWSVLCGKRAVLYTPKKDPQ